MSINKSKKHTRRAMLATFAIGLTSECLRTGESSIQTQTQPTTTQSEQETERSESGPPQVSETWKNEGRGFEAVIRFLHIFLYTPLRCELYGGDESPDVA